MSSIRAIAVLAGLGFMLSAFGNTSETTPQLEEVIVEGEKYSNETYDGFINLNEANRKGARLYKEGRYREAIPYLLTGARVGFKMSQV